MYFSDPEIIQDLRVWRDIVEAQGNMIIGKSLVNLQHSECGYKECNMGNFYTDAVLYKLQHFTLYNQSEWTNISIAVVAAGELYLTWPKGDITYKQIYSLAPFEAPIVAFDLQGKYLKAALEKSVENIDMINNVTRSDAFLQVGGLKIVYNLNKPISKRAVSIKIRCAMCEIPHYEDLNETAIYRIAATHYVGRGGYGFSMFKEYGQNKIKFPTEFESLMDYVKQMSLLYTGLDKRITAV